MKKGLLISLFMVLFGAGSLYASDYTIPEITVDVQITDDGIVQITEHLTYRFDGTFSWAEYSLPMEGFSEVRNIRVFEQDGSYINENTEEAGTFSVSENDDSIFIKWHYNASNTSRVFSISYELTEALTVGPEVSQFFWNYLSSSRDKSTEQLNVTITLPESVSSDELFAWGRIPADRTTINAQGDTFTLQATDISRNESAQFRVIFPSSVFDQNVVDATDPGFNLADVIMEEEQREQKAEEQAEQDAFYASITYEVTLVISLLSILLFVFLYRKYSIRHSTTTISDRDTIMIPDQTRPALIGKLMTSKMTTGNHLVATIFDLARRGWFTIREEEPEEEDGWFSTGSRKSEFFISRAENPPSDSTTTDEQMVIDFVNSQIDSGKNEFSKMISETSAGSAKWYAKWQKEVKQKFDEQEWIDKSTYTGVTLNIVGQLMLMAGAIFILIVGTLLAIIALATTLFMLIGASFMIRRTQSGQEKYHRWKAYISGLKKADKRTIRMEMMDRHFIYATAFHLSEKQINTLIECSDDATVNMIFPWIILTQDSFHTPASLATSVTALAASGTTSFSGVSGGGGAMAGAAGGGASASAG
ncbi:MAG: DUF2207 domain-containing protein [Balneolaceae bacterium]